MPNTVAYIVLLLWPVLATALFQRLPREKALVWSVLAAYMLLPPLTSFDFPGMPEMDKYNISNLCALALTAWVLNEKVSFLPRSKIGKVLIVLYIASPFATVMANPEPIAIAIADVPGMRLYDSASTISYQFMALIPFFLARTMLRTEHGMQVLIGALVIAGLIYSVPMLLEARLSPQLNVWIYGFFAHDFSQSVRGGGYRPMVFMPHGLWVAFFALMTTISALLMLKLGRPEDRPRLLVIFLYLAAVLVLCRSAGPMLYAMALMPLVLVVGRRWQLMFVGIIGVIVMIYPILRGTQMVPLDTILEYAYSYSPERHQSLNFRVENEEKLLSRAAEKSWFGWGGYGRNLILDRITGRILTIPDGQWIIVLGTYGWLGYIAEFGLLVLPLLYLGREGLLQKSTAFSPFACTIALIYAANLMDLLPNATLIPFTWLMAGALMGYTEDRIAQRREEEVTLWRKKLANAAGPRSLL